MKKPTDEEWCALDYQLQHRDIEAKLDVVQQFLRRHSTFTFDASQRVGDEWNEDYTRLGRKAVRGTNCVGIEAHLFVIPVPNNTTYMLRLSYRDSIDESRLKGDLFYQNTREDFMKLTKWLLQLDST